MAHVQIQAFFEAGILSFKFQVFPENPSYGKGEMFKWVMRHYQDEAWNTYIYHL